MNKFNLFIESMGLVDFEGLSRNEYDKKQIDKGEHLLAQPESLSRNRYTRFFNLVLDGSDSVKIIKKNTKLKFKHFTVEGIKYWTCNVNKGMIEIADDGKATLQIFKDKPVCRFY